MSSLSTRRRNAGAFPSTFRLRYGYVLTGSIRSQVDHGKTQVFHAGEHWTEPTGAYHPISENESATEPASLLAIFVVDTTDADRLVTYEQK